MHHIPPFYENSAFYLYLFAWLPFAVFVAFYAARSPWRSTSTGRALMAVAGSLTAVLAFVLLVLVFPQIPGSVKDVLRVLLIGGVSISGWLMLRDLITKQRAARSDQSPV